MARTAEKLDKAAPQQAQPEFDTVDTIKKQKGQSGYQMKPSLDIIKQTYIQEMGDEKGYDDFIKKLASLLQDPNVKLVRFLNTMFLLMRVSEDTVETKIFSLDPPDLIAMAIRDAAKMLKGFGFKKATSMSNLPIFVEIAQKTGLPVKISQSQMMMNGQAVPAYMFELDL